MSAGPAAGRYETAPIQEADARADFRCGKRALDDYFARFALANDRAGIGKTYVLRGDETVGEPPVAGFFTLSMADVEPAQVSSKLSGRLPRYPLPVALIGRLAVHEAMQGRGVGRRLLVDALRRVLDVAGGIGCIGVMVDAKDKTAGRFYARYGFTAIGTESWPRRMFLPLATARVACS